MKYTFIFNNNTKFSVQRMCQIFNIKPGSYYAWKRRGPSARSIKDQRNKKEIHEIWKDKKKRSYGSPRLCAELNDAGIYCGHNRVAKVMRQNGMSAEIRKKHKYKKQKKNEENVTENILNRNFKPKQPNKAWATDITYIPTFTGWAYLCVFIDLFSKLVVGWAVSRRPDTELVMKAFQRAVKFRKPAEGLMVHSDRGCQYTSNEYKNYIIENKYIQSMSRKGNCWDNACLESFFGHFKSENIFEENFYSWRDVKLTTFEYIEGFYNRERRHTSNGFLSPINFEKKNVA